MVDFYIRRKNGIQPAEQFPRKAKKALPNAVQKCTVLTAIDSLQTDYSFLNCEMNFHAVSILCCLHS